MFCKRFKSFRIWSPNISFSFRPLDSIKRLFRDPGKCRQNNEKKSHEPNFSFHYFVDRHFVQILTYMTQVMYSRTHVKLKNIAKAMFFNFTGAPGWI